VLHVHCPYMVTGVCMQKNSYKVENASRRNYKRYAKKYTVTNPSKT